MAEYKGVPLMGLSQPQVTTSEEEEGSRSSENRPVEPGKKLRGRPPGSKNKPKPPIIITKDSESAMRPFVLELSAGCDVIESVSQFAQRRHVGLCVLSGSGAQGQVIGGIVVGTLLAAGPILVIAATFMNPSVHRLPEEDSAAGEDMKPPAPDSGDGCNNNNNSMSMSVYSVASPTHLNTQIQPEHLHWPHTSRPPHF
ncbi:AT-hook motif nuclear-localized protein 17-like [Tasmannia lanceolata]|uniref:AT-hook motif nuclear-localized protein 17-like n=1 Tax=Tasmannia lanceolata TaxID=3420 RepID=UPI004064AEA1